MSDAPAVAAPDTQRLFILIAVMLALGILISALVPNVFMSAGVMSAALLVAGLMIRPAVPAPWAPPVASVIMIVALFVAAVVVYKYPSNWMTGAIGGGGFFAILLSAPKDQNGRQTILGTLIIAAALVYASGLFQGV